MLLVFTQMVLHAGLVIVETYAGCLSIDSASFKRISSFCPWFVEVLFDSLTSMQFSIFLNIIAPRKPVEAVEVF